MIAASDARAIARVAEELLQQRQLRAIEARARLDKLRTSLGPKQNAFLQSKAKRKTLGGSRQSGKSHTLATKLIEVANESKCRSMYVAPTSKAARAALWSKMHALNDEHKLGIELKEGAFKAVFQNGSTIGFEGAHDTARVKRLRGDTLTGVLCVDEAAFFPDPIIRELMGPTATSMFLASPNGQRIIVASSPGLQRRGYCFDLMHNQRDKWEPHALFVQDNPIIVSPEEALRELRDANAWTEQSPAYLREGCGLWVDDATYNVYELADINLLDELPPGPWTTILLVDFGKNDQSALAIAGWRDHDPALYILHVEGASDLDIEDVSQRALALTREFAPIATYGDSGGGGAQHMEYMRKRHQLAIRPVAKKQNYKKPAIDELNADMRRGLYKMLRTSCAVEQMQALQWDPIAMARGSYEEHPSMPNDLCDVSGPYAHIQARHYRAEPKPLPKPTLGTAEHLKSLSDEGLRAAIERANKHNADAEEIEADLYTLTGD